MKTCCEQFARLLSRAGQKGIAVVATCNGTRRQFVLQVRPFEQDVVRKYNQPNDRGDSNTWPELLDSHDRPVPIVTVLQMPLMACPSCGCLLESVIES